MSTTSVKLAIGLSAARNEARLPPQRLSLIVDYRDTILKAMRKRLDAGAEASPLSAALARSLRRQVALEAAHRLPGLAKLPFDRALMINARIGRRRDVSDMAGLCYCLPAPIAMSKRAHAALVARFGEAAIERALAFDPDPSAPQTSDLPSPEAIAEVGSYGLWLHLQSHEIIGPWERNMPPIVPTIPIQRSRLMAATERAMEMMGLSGQ